MSPKSRPLERCLPKRGDLWSDSHRKLLRCGAFLTSVAGVGDTTFSTYEHATARITVTSRLGKVLDSSLQRRPIR